MVNQKIDCNILNNPNMQSSVMDKMRTCAVTPKAHASQPSALKIYAGWSETCYQRREYAIPADGLTAAHALKILPIDLSKSEPVIECTNSVFAQEFSPRLFAYQSPWRN